MDAAADCEAPGAFIGRRREGRWCHGEEMAASEWSSSMLPFQREERKGQHPFQREERKGQDPFQKGNGAGGVTLGSHAEG
jgi:hypothetical protein